jgi:general nucleoside transport system ATP-binding protein
MSLASNALISARNRMKLAVKGWIKHDATREFAERIIQEFGVKARGPDSAARSLSGGNLQKYIVGREILQTPEVLVIAQPTWGVDAGAAAAIHQALFNLAQNGAAIVVVSQDLDELLTLCDRLAVLNVGSLSKAIDTADASMEEIGLLMGGLHGMSAEVPAVHGSAQNVA